MLPSFVTSMTESSRSAWRLMALLIRAAMSLGMGSLEIVILSVIPRTPLTRWTSNLAA